MKVSMAEKVSFAEKIKNCFKDRAALVATLSNFAYWFLTLVYMETLLHALVYNVKFTGNYAFAIGFSAVFACVLTLITSSLPKKAHTPVTIILSLALVILYGSQMVYNFIFGTMYSLVMMKL